MDRRARWVGAIERRVEARVLRSASLILFTAEATAAAYRLAYPQHAEKIHVVRNGFDEAQRPRRPQKRAPGPLRIIHFGNIYGKRSLRVFLLATKQLFDQGALQPGDLSFENLGRVSDEDQAFARQIGLGEYITASPVIPYEEGLARLAAADVQLLLGYGDEELFIPAKLYDYLLSGSRILAQTDSREVCDIVRETETGLSTGSQDVTATAEALLTLRQAAFASSGPAGVAQNIANYSAPAGAAKLVNLLEEAGLLPH